MPKVLDQMPASVKPKVAAKPAVKPAAKLQVRRPKPTAERELKFPTLAVYIMSSETVDSGGGPITYEMAKTMLGWETEKEYVARRMEEDASLDANELGYGTDYWLIDEHGDKIKCSNNGRNRPLDRGLAMAYAQDILNRNWAGPLNIPGETISEAMIALGRTGQVVSGQHRLIGLILAYQLWEGVQGDDQSAHWHQLWPDGPPVLETFLCTGISEDPRVLRVVDNVKTRTESDVYYTSSAFDTIPDAEGGVRSTTVGEKRELSKMMAKCVDLFWQRTGCADNKYHAKQTHSESVQIYDNHPKLRDAVIHLFQENRDRTITGLKLSAGQCACLMYLMAVSKSDGDAYRFKDPRGEQELNFDMWDKAGKLVTLFAGDDASFQPVRDAIARLLDEDDLRGGKAVERHSILIKAWSAWLAGGGITDADLELEFVTSKKDPLMRVLNADAIPCLTGIDVGAKPPEPVSDEVTDPAEHDLDQEKRKADQRREAAEATKKRVEDRKKQLGIGQPAPAFGVGEGAPVPTKPVKKLDPAEVARENSKKIRNGQTVATPPATTKKK